MFNYDIPSFRKIARTSGGRRRPTPAQQANENFFNILSKFTDPVENRDEIWKKLINRQTAAARAKASPVYLAQLKREEQSRLPSGGKGGKVVSAKDLMREVNTVSVPDSGRTPVIAASLFPSALSDAFKRSAFKPSKEDPEKVPDIKLPEVRWGSGPSTVEEARKLDAEARTSAGSSLAKYKYKIREDKSMPDAPRRPDPIISAPPEPRNDKDLSTLDKARDLDRRVNVSKLQSVVKEQRQKQTRQVPPAKKATPVEERKTESSSESKGGKTDEEKKSDTGGTVTSKSYLEQLSDWLSSPASARTLLYGGGGAVGGGILGASLAKNKLLGGALGAVGGTGLGLLAKYLVDKYSNQA